MVPPPRPPIPGTGLKTRIPRRVSLDCLNAFRDQALGLPEAVSPYLFWRQTAVFDLDTAWAVFGPTMKRTGSTGDVAGGWSGTVGIYSSGPNNLLGNTSPGNVGWFTLPNAANPGASVVPAAFSVRIMGRASLTSEAKPVYVFRAQSGLKWRQLNVASYTTDQVLGPVFETSRATAETDVSLAFRPKRIDSVPTNMSDYCRFMDHWTQVTATSWQDGGLDWGGLSPIIIKNASLAALTVEVCLLWRCRPGFQNTMALGATSHHPITPDRTWADIVSAAHSAAQLVESGASAVTSVAGAYSAIAPLL